MQKGFDIELTKKVSNKVKVPIIAHGGAGNFQHVLDVIKKTNVSGVSISSLFHYDIFMNFSYKRKKIGNFYFLENSKKNKSLNNLKRLKLFLKKENISVRC